MEGVNYSYESTGKVWYTIEIPTPGTVSFDIEGNATVSYGTDPEALTVYTAPFIEEYGETKYYILVESTEEVTVVVDVEVPKGTMDNPLEIVVGQDNAVSTNGGWSTYYATYYANANGTLTLTFDCANAVIQCGTHPYFMQTSVTSGTAIEVSAWTTYYFGITTSDNMPANFDIAASFEGEVIEPEEPTDNIGTIIDSMDVVTSDTYGYHDKYTFTADKAGTFTMVTKLNGSVVNTKADIATDAGEVWDIVIRVADVAGTEVADTIEFTFTATGAAPVTYTFALPEA